MEFLIFLGGVGFLVLAFMKSDLLAGAVGLIIVCLFAVAYFPKSIGNKSSTKRRADLIASFAEQQEKKGDSHE